MLFGSEDGFLLKGGTVLLNILWYLLNSGFSLFDSGLKIVVDAILWTSNIDLCSSDAKGQFVDGLGVRVGASGEVSIKVF